MAKCGSVLYKIDYAYIPKDSGVFKNVHIVLNMPKDELELHVVSDENIEAEDLAGIVYSLQKSQFDKMRLYIDRDMKCFLSAGDEIYLFKAIDGRVEITGSVAPDEL